MRTLLNRVGNPILRALLRSPLYGPLSRHVMLITVDGRRTGRRYAVPVQYVRRRDEVYVVSRRDRRWWRNLEGGAPVTLLIGQRTLTGEGAVLTGEAAETAKAVFAGTALARAARGRADAVVIRVGALGPDEGRPP